MFFTRLFKNAWSEFLRLAEYQYNPRHIDLRPPLAECLRARLAHECNVPLYSRMEKWTHPLFHSSQWNDLKLRPVWLAPDLALNNVAQIPEWVFPSHPIKIIINDNTH